jgi:hypothetical protein
MAEFLGAYRLPNSVFGTASADTMTDGLPSASSAEALDKSAELREHRQGPDRRQCAVAALHRGALLDAKARVHLGEFRAGRPLQIPRALIAYDRPAIAEIAGC